MIDNFSLLEKIWTEKQNKLSKICYELDELDNELKKIYEKAKEKENEAEKIKKEKIIFDGIILFKKNIYNSFPMGWMEKFEVKNKTFEVKDGYVELTGIEGDAGGTKKVTKKFYWEDLIEYLDSVVSVDSILKEI